MKMIDLKKHYQAGAISKVDFMAKMYEWHNILFDYCELLRESPLAEIRIVDEGIIMRFGEPPIEFWAPQGDVRILPIDVLNFGTFEDRELEMVKTIISAFTKKPVVVFDVGANGGLYSLALEKWFGAAVRIDAFEPIPATFSLLNRNLLLNGCRQVTAHNFGFLDSPGDVDFFFYPTVSGASGVRQILSDTDYRKVTCRMQTLDTFWEREKACVDLLKCDVEGAELMVFRGGIEMLSACQPIVLTEMLRKWSAKFDYHPNDIIALFAGLGYGCFIVHDKMLREVRAVTDETQETNFLFLHQQKHAEFVLRLAR